MKKLCPRWFAGLDDSEIAVSPVLADFVRLARAAEPFETHRFEHALVLCADSRQPESIFDPQDRFFLVRIAGNLVDPGRLPPGLQGVLVVGHRHGQGRGCGAVEASAAAICSGEPPAHPDLGHVVENCGLTPEENLIAIGDRLEAHQMRVALLLFDHVCAAFEAVRVPPALAGAVGDVVEAVNVFRSTRHDSRHACAGLALAQGQNPPAIVLVQHPLSIHRLLGSTPDAWTYTGPMGCFEVKEGGANLSPGVLASMAYALTHALHGRGSFKDTADAVLIADCEVALLRLAEELSEGAVRSEVLAGFLDRGGRLTGLVIEEGRIHRAVRFRFQPTT